jgi:NADPH:quinone reductase-like Zn-dependent oxidoreductase
MSIAAEAWFIHPSDPSKPFGRAQLILEKVELDEPAGDEVVLEPLYGSWEGNMEHAMQRRPVDVCRARKESRVVIGNAGVSRVFAVGRDVTSVEPGAHVIINCSMVLDEWGYPTKIWGFDAPGTMGHLATKFKAKESELIQLPPGDYDLRQWAPFSAKFATAWSNWRLSWATFRAMLSETDCPAPHVWAWGGGTALAELDLARRNGCNVVFLVGSDRRAAVARETGVTPLDRRPFGELGFDERRITSDLEYRQRYVDAERAFLEEVQRRTEGRGVQIFIDNIGTAVVRVTMKALAREAILATAGWKSGMVVNYLRAAECIQRHQFIHTHGSRYHESLEAVDYAAKNGWLPVVEEPVFDYDQIPELAERYAAGELGVNSLYTVNPE